jgi:hypothetical protein
LSSKTKKDNVFAQSNSGWREHYFGELAKRAKFILSARLRSTAVFITVKYGYNKKIPDVPGSSGIRNQRSFSGFEGLA